MLGLKMVAAVGFDQTFDLYTAMANNGIRITISRKLEDLT